MSTLTPNLGLIKPELSDPADITALNDNWDIIEAILGVTEADNGKVLKVVNGKATWVAIDSAEGVSF